MNRPLTRIDIIARNGNEGLHYLEESMGLLSATELAHLVDQGVIGGVAAGALTLK